MCSTSNPVTKKKLFHYLHFDCMSLYKCRQQNIDIAFFCVENPRQKVPHCAIMFIWDNCHVSNSPLLFCFCLSFSFSCIFNSSSSRSFALYTYSEVKTKTETHFTLFTHMYKSRYVSVLLFSFFKCWGGGGWFLAICLFFFLFEWFSC